MNNYQLQRRDVLRGIAGAVALAATGPVLAGCTVHAGSSETKSAGGSLKGTLQIAQWTNPPAVEVTKKISALFERAHPGVTVQVRDAPNPNNAYGSLTSSLLASNSVDIIAQFPLTPSAFPPPYTGQKPAGFAALVTAGKLTDLTDEPFMKRFDRAQQSYAYGYRGRLYGLMAAQYPAYGGLFYKKDLLKKHDVAIPRTWDEFIAALDKLKSGGVTPIFVAAKDGYESYIWNGMLTQTLMAGHPASASATVGASLAKDFWTGKMTWDDPIYHQVADKYKAAMQYVEPSASGVSALTAAGTWAVQDDNYPFLVDGTFDAATILKANPKLSLGFFTIPSSNDAAVNRVVLNPDLTWVVPTSAPHKELALAWLEFFSMPDNYRTWLAATGSNSTEPAVSTDKVPWMDWLNAHGADGCQTIPGPWVPAGAAPEAGGPVLSDMSPLGKVSIDDELKKAAKAYAKARRQ